MQHSSLQPTEGAPDEKDANGQEEAESEYYDEQTKFGVVRYPGGIPGIEQLGHWRKKDCHQQQRESELAEPPH